MQHSISGCTCCVLSVDGHAALALSGVGQQVSDGSKGGFELKYSYRQLHAN